MRWIFIPYDTIDAYVCVRAVDQQHIRSCRGILGDGCVEGGGGENGDVVVNVFHQDRDRTRSAQRWGTWRQSEEIIYR